MYESKSIWLIGRRGFFRWKRRRWGRLLDFAENEETKMKILWNWGLETDAEFHLLMRAVFEIIDEIKTYIKIYLSTNQKSYIWYNKGRLFWLVFISTALEDHELHAYWRSGRDFFSSYVSDEMKMVQLNTVPLDTVMIVRGVFQWWIIIWFQYSPAIWPQLPGYDLSTTFLFIPPFTSGIVRIWRFCEEERDELDSLILVIGRWRRWRYSRLWRTPEYLEICLISNLKRKNRMRSWTIIFFIDIHPI